MFKSFLESCKTNPILQWRHVSILPSCFQFETHLPLLLSYLQTNHVYWQFTNEKNNRWKSNCDSLKFHKNSNHAFTCDSCFKSLQYTFLKQNSVNQKKKIPINNLLNLNWVPRNQN